MAQITSISFTERNWKLLQNIKNRSELLNKLLDSYFKTYGEDAEAIERELKQLEAQKLALAESENKIILKKKEIESKEASEAEQLDKIKKKQEAKREYLKNAFKADLGRDIKEDELNHYLELEESGESDYFQFLQALKEVAELDKVTTR